MARLINNPLGGISGKVGAVLFKNSKHGTYLSSLPNGNTKKPTELQQLQQSKMKAVMHFLAPLQMILKKTYFPLLQQASAFNSAKSYYLLHSLTSVEEGYSIAYSKCLMSYGDLRIPENVTVQWNGELEVQLTWDPKHEQALANRDDQLFAVVYQPALHQFYFVEHIADREVAHATFLLPEVWSSFTEYHLWVGYCRPEEQKASISVYLGML